MGLDCADGLVHDKLLIQLSFIYLLYKRVKIHSIDISTKDGMPTTIQDIINGIEKDWNCGDPTCEGCQRRLKDKEENNHENKS